VLDYIFSNLNTYITIYQQNGDASPENYQHTLYNFRTCIPPLLEAISLFRIISALFIVSAFFALISGQHYSPALSLYNNQHTIYCFCTFSH